MSEPTTLSLVVRNLLAELRDRLNTNYRQRVALGAKIDGPSWLRHIEQYIAPIVEAVHVAAPDRSKETLLELYDIGLDLSALGHFNEVGGSLRVIELWRDTFPAIASVLSLNPRIVVGSLSNAVLYLNQCSSSKTDSWLMMLRRLGPSCHSVEELLNLGKFLGWTSGFSHMRQSSLQIATDLRVDLLRTPLGIPDQTADSQVRVLLRELSSNPWANPSSHPRTTVVAEVSRCGNFRGLDGEFLQPPKTFVLDGVIHITDGFERWQLHADRFGNTLQRVDSKSSIPRPQKTIPHISNNGLLTWNTSKIQRSDLAHCSSQSFDGTTFAVTIPTSYHVFLFALQAP